MPNRKKKQSRKKNKLNTIPDICSVHFSDKDCFEDAVEWVRNGNYRFKAFAERLPYTVRAISQGLVHHDHVGNALETIYVWMTHSDEMPHLIRLSCVLADFIALPAKASWFERALCSHQLGQIVYHPQQGAREAETGIESFLVQAIKRVRTSNLDTHSDDEAFRDSPVITLSETSFVNEILAQIGEMDSDQLGRECEKARRAAQTFLRITLNFHRDFYKCWECSKVFENVHNCGTCKAAVYCSRKCQARAWKGGHKNKCDRLKTMHEMTLAGIDEIQKAHWKGTLDGFKLCIMPDSLAMSHCMDCGGSLDWDANSLTCSMKHFYENLGRIIRGEWWVYDLSIDIQTECPDSASAENDTVACDRMKVLGYLTVDWVEGARTNFGTDDPEKVTAFVDPFFRQVCGPPISAEAFLEFYMSSASIQFRSVEFTPTSYEQLKKWYANLH